MYKPNYQISDEMLNQIAKIEAIRSRVRESYILPEREIEMRYRATVEATHSSTSIEGNPLGIKQVERVLSGQQLTRHEYAEIEVKNYKEALDFIDKRKLNTTPITTEDILRIHKLISSKLLPPEKSGRWRQRPVYIEDQDGNIKYTAPAVGVVAHEVENLLAWLGREAGNIHPVLAAAILHYQFVSIHPFADGNGRTTRALTTLYLGLRDFDFRGSIVLDSYYSVDRRAYYGALSLGSGYQKRVAADLRPWLDYFISGFLSSARVLNAEITVLANIARPVFDKERMRMDEADILGFAKQFGSVTLSDVATILPNMSRRTAQRRLKKLVSDGLLVIGGVGRNTKYLWRE